MAQKRLGVVVSAPDSSAVLTSIVNLEQRGIPAAWLTSAGAGGADPLGALAGAALRTQHMLLGTAITQTFPRHPNMFHAAGFPEVTQGSWSDAMIDAVALWGNEARVAEAIAGLFALGATEVLVSPVPAGNDRAASLERTLRLLSQVAQAGQA